jgi:hypothetical protein
MTKIQKMQAILWKLSRIQGQERKIVEIDIEEAIARTSDEMLDLFYQKLVKGR